MIFNLYFSYHISLAKNRLETFFFPSLFKFHLNVLNWLNCVFRLKYYKDNYAFIETLCSFINIWTLPSEWCIIEPIDGIIKINISMFEIFQFLLRYLGVKMTSKSENISVLRTIVFDWKLYCCFISILIKLLASVFVQFHIAI